MDDYVKFKNLLAWFVNQLNINNGVTKGEKVTGFGYTKNSSLRKYYAEYRNYTGFDLDCTINSNYGDFATAANYINLAGTSLNVIPVFDAASKVVTSLYIGNHPPKTPIDRKSDSVAVADLGLLETEPNNKLKHFFDVFKQSILEYKSNSAATVDEKTQRAAFRRWYASNAGSLNSANTISTAIGKTRLKSGRPLFAIAEFRELDSAINISGLKGFFQSDDGDYTKMDAAFDIELTTQRDDLKSGIKYYLNFLESTTQAPSAKVKDQGMEKNLILYGPPGTGKTYTAVMYAVSIIDDVPLAEVAEMDYKTQVKPRYDELKAAGLIEFTTFHQSFSYEEFVEGIRPVISDDEEAEESEQISYRIVPGVFKKFCSNIKHGKESSNQELFEDAWLKLSAAAKRNSSTYIFTRRRTNSTFTAKLIKDTVFRVEWDSDAGSHNDITMTAVVNQWISSVDRSSLTGGNRWMFDARQAVIDELVEKYGLKYAELPCTKNQVFIIDEINRGDISRIFGDLITLIEPNKRIDADEELTVILPYSKKEFGVPDNVYILGTMNTADRSIALLDTALRRRFSFAEILPDSSLFKDVVVETDDISIDIRKLLSKLNERITVLLDREHTIGHSFFLPLRDMPKIGILASIFENKILPLLQEYFFDDYEKIQLVLGDNQKKNGQPQFVIKKEAPSGLFGGDVDEVTNYYEIKPAAFKEPRAYEYLQ